MSSTASAGAHVRHAERSLSVVRCVGWRRTAVAVVALVLAALMFVLVPGSVKSGGMLAVSLFDVQSGGGGSVRVEPVHAADGIREATVLHVESSLVPSMSDVVSDSDRQHEERLSVLLNESRRALGVRCPVVDLGTYSGRWRAVNGSGVSYWEHMGRAVSVSGGGVPLSCSESVASGDRVGDAEAVPCYQPLTAEHLRECGRGVLGEVYDAARRVGAAGLSSLELPRPFPMLFVGDSHVREMMREVCRLLLGLPLCPKLRTFVSFNLSSPLVGRLAIIHTRLKYLNKMTNRAPAVVQQLPVRVPRPAVHIYVVAYRFPLPEKPLDGQSGHAVPLMTWVRAPFYLTQIHMMALPPNTSYRHILYGRGLWDLQCNDTHPVDTHRSVCAAGTQSAL